MTIKEVIKYVMHTPYNTNKAVLEQMLKDLIIEHGGTITPDTDNDDVIYDGGVEV